MLKHFAAILNLALGLGLLAIELELMLILYQQLRDQYRSRRRKRHGETAADEADQQSAAEKSDEGAPKRNIAIEELTFHKTERDQALKLERKDEGMDKTEEAMPEPPLLEPGKSEFEVAFRSDPAQRRRPNGGLPPPPAGAKPEGAAKLVPAVIEGEQSQAVIRLGFEREWKADRYSSSSSDIPVIIEKEDGDLKVVRIVNNVDYYVAPYGEILAGSGLSSSVIDYCFKMITENKGGKKYRVTGMKEAILKKEHGVYKLYRAGELSIEGV